MTGLKAGAEDLEIHRLSRLIVAAKVDQACEWEPDVVSEFGSLQKLNGNAGFEKIIKVDENIWAVFVKNNEAVVLDFIKKLQTASKSSFRAAKRRKSHFFLAGKARKPVTENCFKGPFSL